MLAITKEQIAQLPIVTYGGTPVLCDTLEAAVAAIRALSAEPVVGFDTETRPSFKKGHPHSVALLQLATASACYLIRLNIVGIFPELQQFFENDSTLKIGLSIKDDFQQMRRMHPLEPKGFVDLQQFVKKFDIADNSLQKIYALIFGRRISKSQRLTNWEAPILTHAQQAYAALDAWACLQIYNTLTAGDFDPATSPFKAEQ